MDIDVKMDDFINKLAELTNGTDLPISVIESIGSNWINEVRRIKAIKLYQEKEKLSNAKTEPTGI